jgi:Ion channel
MPLTIDNPGAVNHESIADRRGQFRYGAVFLLTFAAVVFVIAAPSADWSRAVTVAIESAALVVAIATSRERERVRHRRALAVGIVMVVLLLGVGIGVVSEQLTAILLALVTAAVPVEIVRGLVRLLRERGVTLQAVAGALAIYLSIGLVFAWIISIITHVDSAAYFAQHTNGTEGDRVYFSFTVLTTTGFGDFSAATPVGHALAVIEMLTGQLYLVTVIGLLIGSFVERRKTT